MAATDATIFPNGNPLTTNPFFADCAGAQQLQQYITYGADYEYNGNQNSLSTPGSFNNNNTVINVINGDANLSAADLRLSPADTGAGILLVTGNLTMAGNSNYHGIIIVMGGTITIGGGGGGTITGGIYVTNTTTCPAALGTSQFNPLGGAITIQYDSTWANPVLGWLPMQVLSMN